MAKRTQNVRIAVYSGPYRTPAEAPAEPTAYQRLLHEIQGSDLPLPAILYTTPYAELPFRVRWFTNWKKLAGCKRLSHEKKRMEDTPLLFLISGTLMGSFALLVLYSIASWIATGHGWIGIIGAILVSALLALPLCAAMVFAWVYNFVLDDGNHDEQLSKLARQPEQVIAEFLDCDMDKQRCAYWATYASLTRCHDRLHDFIERSVSLDAKVGQVKELTDARVNLTPLQERLKDTIRRAQTAEARLKAWLDHRNDRWTRAGNDSAIKDSLDTITQLASISTTPGMPGEPLSQEVARMRADVGEQIAGHRAELRALVDHTAAKVAPYAETADRLFQIPDALDHDIQELEAVLRRLNGEESVTTQVACNAADAEEVERDVDELIAHTASAAR